MAAEVESKFKWDKPDKKRIMPTKKVYASPVEVDRKLYVIGGCDHVGKPIDTFEVYNTSNGKWTRLAQMPTPRAGSLTLTVGKKIVVLGGVGNNQEPVDAVEIYDIEKGTWTKGSALVEPILGLSGIVKDNEIYVVGGMKLNGNPSDQFAAYNIEDDNWRSLPRMPTERYATFSFLINDKLYNIGGRQGKLPRTDLEVYCFSEKIWRKLPNVPSARVFALYITSDKYIYSCGGLKDHPKEFVDNFDIFDLEKETWTEQKMMNSRADFAIGYIKDKLIVAGGLGKQGKPLLEAEAYNPETDTWEELPSMAIPHCSCSYYTIQDRLYVIGGLSVGGVTAEMQILRCS